MCVNVIVGDVIFNGVWFFVCVWVIGVFVWIYKGVKFVEKVCDFFGYNILKFELVNFRCVDDVIIVG